MLSSSGATLVTPGSSATTTGPQAKVVPQQAATSQPITVQIQHTEQGTRLMFPGTLSQLPASLLQIVQSGQQILPVSTSATSQPASQASALPQVAVAASATTVTTTASSTGTLYWFFFTCRQIFFHLPVDVTF